MTETTPPEAPVPATESSAIPVPVPPGGEPKPAKRKAGLGTWAFVLGIVGIFFAIIPGTSGFGIVLALVALVLGGIGLLLKGRRALVGTILGGAALILGIVFLNAYSGLPSSSLSSDAGSSGTVGSSAKSAAPAKPAVPAGTVAQLQALSAAKDYLGDDQGFSEAGLLGQLTSSFGNGFDKADAQWAIDHSGADWNAQAVISAEGYLSDKQGFSKAGLIAQLASHSGSQFTKAQAKYAVAQAGADWNAQAVIAAKGYLSDGEGFSRNGLIQQLTSPYGSQFTRAQAEYAVAKVGLK